MKKHLIKIHEKTEKKEIYPRPKRPSLQNLNPGLSSLNTCNGNIMRS